MKKKRVEGGHVKESHLFLVEAIPVSESHFTLCKPLYLVEAIPFSWSHSF